MTFMERVTLVLGVLAALGALAWRAWLAREKRRHEALVARRAIVDGTISANRGPGEDMYNAVISYTVDGASYRIVGSEGSYRPWPIGKTIRVAYDRDSPSDAVEAEFDGAWDLKLSRVLGFAGIVLAGAACMGILE